MLNFNRADRIGDPKDAPKSPLKPALYEPPAPAAAAAPTPAPAVSRTPPPNPAREAAPAPAAERAAPTMPPPAVAAPSTTASNPVMENRGSRLIVGANIKLKGVEISDCDVLVIEGLVEATVNSAAMQIERPGTLTGTAVIDVAEVHGEFTGELTARTRLIVHGSGKVRGTIRYGKLVVEEGGEISGDVRRLDGTETAAPTSGASQGAERKPAMPEGAPRRP